MSDPKDFVAVVDSDARKTPRRIAFITKRTSPQVHVKDEERVMTYPEVFFRTAVAIEVLAIALVIISLRWNAPLEGLADPMHTPNPAKAPWYFLGLQELLHYFPPVVAGVLIPGLVVMALIVIPYFNINVEAEGCGFATRPSVCESSESLWLCFCIFLAVFDVWVALVPTDYRRRIHAAGRANRSENNARISRLAGQQTAVVLDHDLVLIRTGRADRYRHFLPRPGMVLGAWPWRA